MNKLVCVTGLPGSGKSFASEYFIKKGFKPVWFGQITLDEIEKRGLTLNEKNEKKIREELRKKHGMAVFAKLNFPRIKKILRENDVIVDGLYSFEEYTFLKRKLGKKIYVIAVFAPPELRYERLAQRKIKTADSDKHNRTLTKKEAKERDTAQLRNLNMGPTIALADYTILNTGNLSFFKKQLQQIYEEIQKTQLG